MAATDKALQDLHAETAKILTEIVVGVEEWTGEVEEDGETPVMRKRRPSAGELAVAVKFLKDNSVFADPSQSDATAALKAQLAARGRKPTARDTSDALRSIGQDLIQ